MPLPYRVPFSQACGVFWTLYLSILNSEFVFHAFINLRTVFLTWLIREDKRQDRELEILKNRLLAPNPHS